MSEADKPSAELVAFLSVWLGRDGGPVERFDTHGAVVLVGERETLKLKRPVRYSYMDFSTLAKRHEACRRELAVNAPHAPAIYLGLVAVTAKEGGGFEFDGKGAVVEWAVKMRSFPQSDLLERMIEQGPLPRTLVVALGDMAVRYHGVAPRVEGRDTRAQLGKVIADIDATLRTHPDAFPAALRENWRSSIDARLAQGAALLAERSRAGEVRRVHGDMHLGNIVMWEGAPVAFDAIEFDENLAAIDTLYDLAFLLMDLDRHGARGDANVVLNRYLWRRQSAADLDGLALVPLFLSVRAGVRAMVGAQRADLAAGAQRDADYAAAKAYLRLADGYLAPPPPVLIAIGGWSGTGKSTLAAALAPQVGAAPGAAHLRSDLERKALLGVGETHRLGPEGYTHAVTREVYAQLIAKAQRALAAGHSVILDAVHGTEQERADAAALAGALGVPFAGFWLEASVGTMKARVDARRGDASDATAQVVAQQSTQDAGRIDWRRIDASGTPVGALAAVRAHLLTRDMLKKAVENS